MLMFDGLRLIENLTMIVLLVKDEADPFVKDHLSMPGRVQDGEIAERTQQC